MNFENCTIKLITKRKDKLKLEHHKIILAIYYSHSPLTYFDPKFRQQGKKGKGEWRIYLKWNVKKFLKNSNELSIQFSLKIVIKIYSKMIFFYFLYFKKSWSWRDQFVFKPKLRRYFCIFCLILKKKKRWICMRTLGVSMFDPTREHDTNPIRFFSG